jgi:hypothetical protein
MVHEALNVMNGMYVVRCRKLVVGLCTFHACINECVHANKKEGSIQAL